MDRRHWWLVSKLQESFGDSLRSAQLETFLCQEGTLPTLLAFTGEKSPPAIYVWRQSSHSDDATRKGHPPQLRSGFGSTSGPSGPGAAPAPPGSSGSNSPLSASLSRSRRQAFGAASAHGHGAQAAPATSAVADDAAPGAAADDAGGTAAASADGVRFAMDTSPPAEFLDKCVYFLRLRHRRQQHDAAIEPLRDPSPGASASLASISEHGAAANGDAAAAGRHSDGVMSPFDQDADPETFASHVLWGEIEGNLTCDMHAVFNSVLLPRIARQDWGAAHAEEVHNLRQAVDKFFAALPDSNVILRAAHLRSVTLRTSHDPYFVGFVPGARPADPSAQATAESIVEDWIETMEGVLREASQERPGHLKGVWGEEEF